MSAESLIALPERGQIPHSLALGVVRFSAAFQIIAPIRDKAPTERLERYLSGLVIATDDQQFLARRGVPLRRIVVHAAVAHVRTIDDGAHGPDIVICQRAGYGMDRLKRDRRAA
jgi:hypothetical protein